MKPKANLGPYWVTVAEAAQILGLSVQGVHKRLKSGRFPYELSGGVRVLRRDGLEAAWFGSSQRLADMPPQGRAAISGGWQQEPDWDAIGALLSEFLPDWPSPPWDADQACTLSQCLAMAQEASNG
jgi:hypothetical protein